MTNPPRDATIQAPVYTRASTRRHLSDWVHPCVLLEMRRAVRTNLFVLVFLGLHLVVIGGILIQLVLPSMPGTDKFTLQIVHGAFWISVVPPFLIALPFTALFTLSHDLHIGVMETVLMTRLGPLGVAIGKWTSKLVEALLMATTLMPYTVLRYYMYGTNPLLDLTNLSMLVIACAYLCAVGVALSTVRGIIIRIVGALLAGFCNFLVFSWIILYLVVMNYGAGIPSTFHVIPWVVAAECAVGIVAALGYAACAIGPAAYNGAIISRLAGLAMVIPWVIGVYHQMPSEVLIILQVYTGLILLTPQLLENVQHPAGTRPAVLRAARSGKFMDAVMLPGWQAGFWWVVLTLVVWATPILFAKSITAGLSSGSSTPSAQHMEFATRVLLVSTGALFFPFVLIRLYDALRRRSLQAPPPMRPDVAFILNIGVLVVCVGAALVCSEYDRSLPPGMFFVPPLQLAGIFMYGPSDEIESVFYVAATWPVFVMIALAMWEQRVSVNDLRDEALASYAAARRPEGPVTPSLRRVPVVPYNRPHRPGGGAAPPMI